MDTNAAHDIKDEELDAVVGGLAPVQAATAAKSAKSKTPDIVEHHEGGNPSTR